MSLWLYAIASTSPIAIAQSLVSLPATERSAVSGEGLPSLVAFRQHAPNAVPASPDSVSDAEFAIPDALLPEQIRTGQSLLVLPRNQELLPLPTNHLQPIRNGAASPMLGISEEVPPGVPSNSPGSPSAPAVIGQTGRTSSGPPGLYQQPPDTSRLFPWQVISPESGQQLNELPGNQVPKMDQDVRIVPYDGSGFTSTPLPIDPYDPVLEMSPYRGKFAIQTQRPWLELGRQFYGSGLFPPPPTWFGPANLAQPQFLVYGDFRSVFGSNQDRTTRTQVWANRLNLDVDLRLTSTERIHGFTGPLDHGNEFTGVVFDGRDTRFANANDVRFDTLFFEGDVGNIYGGLAGVQHPFDLPFTFGLAPLLFQNGVWMEDVVGGAAVTIPARHSSVLRWSNFDATFFCAIDNVNSPAFGNNSDAADVFGTAWFIEAYEGYIETGYAYLNDTTGQGRSYHNATIAFTRRYWQKLSNAVRVIGNFGQDLPSSQQTADGVIFLVENSLVTSNPYTVVPYFNAWYGVGRTQSVARAAGSGGILRNTGINFESDGLTNYPTLDATGVNTFGTALGVDLLGYNFRDQWIVEVAALGATGPQSDRNALGDQYGLGTRYQRTLTTSTLVRFDLMYGWLLNERDITGARCEWRWKF